MFANATHKKPDSCKPPKKCDPERAVENVRRMIKQWPDYVNTGNVDYLIKNWIFRDATITVTGEPLAESCETRVESMLDYLYYRDSARILGDIVNIKAIQYKKNGDVIAVFVMAAGFKGHDLELYNESWIFSPKSGCDYALSEAAEIKVGCLSQEPVCYFHHGI